MNGSLTWIVLAILYVISSALTLWMAGAIFYDLCQGTRWGRILAAAWVGGILAMFAAWQPVWQPFVVLLCVVTAFLLWWIRLKPSHDRNWDPSVALLPEAVCEGDVVAIDNVRNFDYLSQDNFKAQYENRISHLANLKSADIIFFYWGSAWMSHPVLVFDFGPDGRICGSIEVRYRKGQKYSTLRSLYRQQELIFVVANERDVILRRTKFGRKQKAFLYHFNASPSELRTVFLDYMQAINRLKEAPRWYHGLCANCTTSFYRLPHSRVRFDWRVIANGRLDWALYQAGRLDRSLPFTELRQIAYITDIANGAPEQGFGDYIRRELEERRHGR